MGQMIPRTSHALSVTTLIAGGAKFNSTNRYGMLTNRAVCERFTQDSFAEMQLYDWLRYVLVQTFNG